jgi:hypothetical protein
MSIFLNATRYAIMPQAFAAAYTPFQSEFMSCNPEISCTNADEGFTNFFEISPPLRGPFMMSGSAYSHSRVAELCSGTERLELLTEEDLNEALAAAKQGDPAGYERLAQIASNEAGVEYFEDNYHGWEYEKIIGLRDVPHEAALASRAMWNLIEMAIEGYELAFQAIEGIVTEGKQIPNPRYQLRRLAESLSTPYEQATYERFPLWLRTIAMIKNIVGYGTEEHFGDLIQCFRTDSQYTLFRRIGREILGTLDVSFAADRIWDDVSVTSDIYDCAAAGNKDAIAMLRNGDVSSVARELRERSAKICKDFNIVAAHDSGAKIDVLQNEPCENEAWMDLTPDEADARFEEIHHIQKLVWMLRYATLHGNRMAAEALVDVCEILHCADKAIKNICEQSGEARTIVKGLLESRNMASRIAIRRLLESLDNPPPKEITMSSLIAESEEEDTSTKLKRACFAIDRPIDWNLFLEEDYFKLGEVWNSRALEKMYDLIIRQGRPLNDLLSQQNIWIFSESEKEVLQRIIKD